MRKYQVLIWAPEASPAFFRRLREQTQQLLCLPSLSDLQLNLADADVAAAADKRMSAGTAQLFDALCSFCWQGEGGPDAVLKLLSADGQRTACYQVEAEEPLPHLGRSAEPGERTEGFSQIALLRCPGFLSYDDWLGDWKGRHTAVAIETQSTFRYVQNRVVARPADGTAYDAIVEECFPATAMSNAEVFYDAEGKPELFQQRLQAMMDSCARFIDFSEIEVVPTSEYRY